MGPRYADPRYLQTVALRMGVPRFWVEDAAQDMALALWREGATTLMAIHRRAVDAVRRYGVRDRHRVRPSMLPLKEASAVLGGDTEEAAMTRLLIGEALAIMGRGPAYQRRAVARWLAGESYSLAGLAHARKRLRAMAGA